MRMDEFDIFKELFDEKVVKVISLFLENPERQFSLSEISSMAKVNISTTYRILNKLAGKNFISLVPIGKIKAYQLSKNEKMKAISKMLSKGNTPLNELIEKLKLFSNIKKIILESSSPNHAKIILVVEHIETFLNERIAKVCGEVDKKYNFHTEVMELSERQFSGLNKFGSVALSHKVIWERNSI